MKTILFCAAPLLLLFLSPSLRADESRYQGRFLGKSCTVKVSWFKDKTVSVICQHPDWPEPVWLDGHNNTDGVLILLYEHETFRLTKTLSADAILWQGTGDKGTSFRFSRSRSEKNKNLSTRKLSSKATYRGKYKGKKCTVAMSWYDDRSVTATLSNGLSLEGANIRDGVLRFSSGKEVFLLRKTLTAKKILWKGSNLDGETFEFSRSR